MNRRELIKAGGAAMVVSAVRELGAAEVNKLKLGVIIDEISDDVEAALRFVQGYGLRWVEVRKVWGEFITESNDATVRKLRDLLKKYKMSAGMLCSAHLKTTYPGSDPLPIDRDQFQLFNLSYKDQPALLERSIGRAKDIGAPYVRIFSFWRTKEPAKLFDNIAEDLTKAAEMAARMKMKLALENEHSTNIASGAETGQIMQRVDHPAIGVNFDPGNAFVIGDRPYPDGYSKLPKKRLWHTHVKDAVRDPKTRKHTWKPIGKGEIDYPGYLRALLKDGFDQMISLETHYVHPTGNKELASKESLEGLMDVLKKV